MLSFTRKRLYFLFLFVGCAVFAGVKFGSSSEAQTRQRALAASVTATETVALAPGGDATNNGFVNPGDTVQYTVTINNTAAPGAGNDALGAVFTDTLNANQTLVAGSLKALPIAGDDVYSVTGNVRISATAGTLLTNDVRPLTGTNAGLTVISIGSDTTAPFSFTTTNGGTVTATTGDGGFQYDPPVGFEGSGANGDTFTYVVTDPDGLTGTGAVRLDVSGMFWFIDNSAAACTTIAAGCGRLSMPFSTFGAFSAANVGGGSNPDINDNIFIYNTGAAYTGGLALLNGQKLIGQGATASLSTITGLTFASLSVGLPISGGPRPVISNATGGGIIANGVGGTNVIRGITFGAVANGNLTKLGGANFGTITIGNNVAPDVQLIGSGRAIDFTNGSFAASSGLVDVISTGGGTHGIVLLNVAGTINFGPTTIGGAATQGISISGSAVNATFGTTQISGTTAQGILIGTSTGNITFGNTTITGGTDGVSLQNNSAGTRTFGTLTATGGSGSAFLHAVGGGIVNVTGAATLSSAQTAINVNAPSATSSIIFQGATSATSTTAFQNSLNWVGTASATMAFESLTLQRNNGVAFNASGGGTITVLNGTGSITNTTAGGPAIFASNVALNLNFSAINSTSSSNGVNLTNVIGTSNFGGGDLSGASGVTFLVSGGLANLTYNGTLTQTAAARVIDIQNTTGGVKNFGGLITSNNGTGQGIFLNSNTGGTINFTGGMGLSTAANPAFTATGGGTVSATQNNTSIVNTLATTSAVALNVSNTTIGATGLIFRSITSNGAANGIILNTTGASGGLTISGNGGTCSSVATCTGGSISGGAIGVALTSTRNVSIDRMFIQNTTNSGVSGTGVTNFSFTNGATSGIGNGDADSSIAFNGNPVGAGGIGRNLDGTLTVTGNTFTNSFYSGVDVQSDDGTITNATVSNNTIVNPGFSGVNFVGTGNASTSIKLNRATVNQNNISGSGGNGIQFSIGNGSATGPGTVAGSLATASDIISITNNTVSSIDSTGTQAITMANTSANPASRAKTNFLIQCNGRNTGGCSAPTNTPLASSSLGTVILIGNNGYADMTGTLDQNTIVATQTPNLGGGNGIAGGNGVGGVGAAWTPNLTLTVTSNAISGTDGNGVLLVDRATNGTAKMKIANNTVGMSVNAGGSARPGIRVDAGNGTAGENCSVFLNAFGNAAVGSNGAGGIGVRKQGTNAAVNNFGILDAAGGPTLNVTPSNTDVTNFIDALNPASSPASFIINGSNYTRDTTQAPPRPGLIEDGTIETARNGDNSSNFLNASHLRSTLDAIQPWEGEDSAQFIVQNALFEREPANTGTTNEQMGLNVAAQPSVETQTGSLQTQMALVQEQMTPVQVEMVSEEIQMASDTTRMPSDEAQMPSDETQYTGYWASVAEFADKISDMISPTVYAQDDVKTAAPESGETITVNGAGSGFTIPAGKSTTITFQAQVAPVGVIPANTFSISNQGSVSGTGFGPVLTDDPNVAGAANPTVTTVVQPPLITATFTPTTVNNGSPSTLTYTITNNNPGQPLSALTFSDTFPTSPGSLLVNASPSTTNTCGGAFTNLAGTTIVAGNTGVKLSSPPSTNTIASNGGSCTLSVKVSSTVQGTYTNSTEQVSSLEGAVGAPSAPTTLNVTLLTAAGVSVSGRVLTGEGRGVRNAVVVITDAQGISKQVLTTQFGGYQFDDVEAGQNYIITVMSRRYQFTPRVLSVVDQLTDIDLIAEP